MGVEIISKSYLDCTSGSSRIPSLGTSLLPLGQSKYFLLIISTTKHNGKNYNEKKYKETKYSGENP